MDDRLSEIISEQSYILDCLVTLRNILDSGCCNDCSQDYILNCLVTLRNILDSGCCNDCSKKTTCDYVPELGKLVRYNCPFYEKKGVVKDGRKKRSSDEER